MKKVKVTFDWWEMLVEINPCDKTLAGMKEQLLFWTGGEGCIDAEDGDIESAFLKMLAAEILPLSQEYNLRGINNYFNEAEGWLPVDGTFGVKVIDLSAWEFMRHEMDVDEIPVAPLHTESE
tara:strand:+ start:379 stop:744 length:366 start_codon:yes stop_codon:yes gene_type:complete